MRLPPEPILTAAKRWLELLPESGGVPRAQALLANHPDYSDLTPTQYATALTWLRELDILEPVDMSEGPSGRILSAIFEKAAPPWVQDADLLVRSPDELPSDIVGAGSALGLDAKAVHAQLLTSWGKVDTAARELVGAAGEVALVRLLESIPGAHVDHVATRSDGFGYDITFELGNSHAHIEVKSTTRVGRFTAYLSRHEYAVMMRDDLWLLAAVRLTPELGLASVGSVPRSWLAANAPRDDGPFGTWASVKLEIPTEAITEGLPQLGEHTRGVLGDSQSPR